VFRCWDLAIPQLKSGTKARISCPSKYAWGAIEADSPLGGEPIPKNTDVTFDVEVVDCNKAPEN
jgi:FKBP-type peptidyl-prolyl cis-trans isomerase